MKIFISNSSKISITSEDDLACIIPPDANGKVLNYGQGEGQVMINGKVWGIYCHSDRKSYVVQYEEGSLDWGSFQRSITGLLDHLRNEFGAEINFIVEGCLEDHEPHEKYT